MGFMLARKTLKGAAKGLLDSKIAVYELFGVEKR
jgi:hypothetical protein